MTDIARLDASESAKGFGEHSQPINKGSWKLTQRVMNISLKVLKISIGGIALSSLIIFFPPASLAGFYLFTTSSVSCGTSLTAYMLASVYHNKIKLAVEKFVTNDLRLTLPAILPLGKEGKTQSIACQDSQEAFAWKMEAIRNAKKSIVLSGNYCGGESFDQMLDLIKERLTANHRLNVVILSSEKFLTAENKQRLTTLESSFHDRFSLVPTGNIWHISPGLKLSTNHSKCLVIDGGAYFILGGSGIEDKYVLGKGLGDLGTNPENPKTDENLYTKTLNWFLPRGFRDQDFVFHSPKSNGVGARVYLEMLCLARRWEGINAVLQKTKLRKNTLAASLIYQFSNNPKRLGIHTRIPHFDTHTKKVDSKTKIYCTGPEQTKNPFEQEIVRQITEAKKRILINHLYFHPTQSMMDALVAAANRGVQIKICTNGHEEYSPTAHSLFGQRNRWNYSLLLSKIDDDKRSNLKIFEFSCTKTTLHKKVIVVDDTVIAGSSNIGNKSLVSMSDHEINFVSKSKHMANDVARIFNLDTSVMKKNAVQVTGPTEMTLAQKLSCARHRIFAPLIG